MYENKHKPLITRNAFTRRLIFHVFLALILFLITLAIGIVGHIYFDNMEANKAFIASITLVSGLGLSILPETTSGQLFAGIYGIYSGYVYVTTSAIIIAPIFHRILHKFHMEE